MASRDEIYSPPQRPQWSRLQRLRLVEKTNYQPMLTAFGTIVSIAAGVVALLTVAAALSITVESRNCAFASRQYHRATHYDWLAGCYISIGGGQSIGLDKYRAFQQVGK